MPTQFSKVPNEVYPMLTENERIDIVNKRIGNKKSCKNCISIFLLNFLRPLLIFANIGLLIFFVYQYFFNEGVFNLDEINNSNDTFESKLNDITGRVDSKLAEITPSLANITEFGNSFNQSLQIMQNNFEAKLTEMIPSLKNITDFVNSFNQSLQIMQNNFEAKLTEFTPSIIKVFNSSMKDIENRLINNTI